mmetsp:Transcript_35869/g.55037  ORF Transcript_35869/g.55037 Transcript_35869/m.55037 type:complete len:185 (+) Transcript_35869:1454-2008(+)
MNEDEKADYEEKIQARIGEVWQKMEVKQEVFQKEYEEALGLVIEDVAQTKFERLAELKIMYKADPEEFETEKKKLLEEMDQLKKTKIAEAKTELESKKKEIQEEKAALLKSVKEELRAEQNQEEDPEEPKARILGSNKKGLALQGDLQEIEETHEPPMTGTGEHKFDFGGSDMAAGSEEEMEDV